MDMAAPGVYPRRFYRNFHDQHNSFEAHAPPADPNRLLRADGTTEDARDPRVRRHDLPEPEAKLKKLAQDYWEELLSQSDDHCSCEDIGGAVHCGDKLLDEAGHWLPSVLALRWVWEEELRKGHMQGVWNETLEESVPGYLLQYCRTQAREGARARQQGTTARTPCKPHTSALLAMDKLWSKTLEDARLGRVLLCSQDHPALDADLEKGEEYYGVLSCPLGAVEKQTVHREFSGTYRGVFDLIARNAEGDPRNHPCCLAPKYTTIARAVCYLRYWFPNIPILFSKLDVDSAFKRIWMRPEDMGRCATDFPPPDQSLGPIEKVAGNYHSLPPVPAVTREEPGPMAFFHNLAPYDAQDELGRPSNRGQRAKAGAAGWVTAISLVACFGGSGSPGEWIVWAWLIKAAHAARYPVCPEWHGTRPFWSAFLMDDQVLCEAALGCRPWLSYRAALECTLALLGESAFNVAKGAIEAAPSLEKIIWGIVFLTTNPEGAHVGMGTVALPKAKITKALCVYQEPQLDGYWVTVWAIQVCRGVAEWIANVQPSIRPELKVFDAMLKGASLGQTYVDPPGAEETCNELWEEFRETCAFFRVLLARQECWGVAFTNSMRGVLSVRERLAIPGELERVLWSSGDATLTRMSFVLWSRKKFFTLELDRYYEALAALAGTEERDCIIAVAEFLLVAIAGAVLKEDLSDHLWLYAGDNQVTLIWLEKRTAGIKFGRYLLRLIDFMEVQERFQLLAFYIRSHHNYTPDALTREEWEDVAKVLLARGYEQIDAQLALQAFLQRGMERRAWVYEGQHPEQQRVALQLAEMRRVEATSLVKPEKLLRAPTGARLHEWRASTAAYARAWTAFEGQVSLSWAQCAPGEIREEAESRGWGVSKEGEESRCDVWAGSFTDDPQGREVGLAAASWKRCRPRWVVADFPTLRSEGGPAYVEAVSRLTKAGYCVHHGTLLTSLVGEPHATKRLLLWAAGEEAPGGVAPPQLLEIPRIRTASAAFAPLEEVDSESWLRGKEWEFTRDPSCRSNHARGLPRSLGKIKNRDTRGTRLVYSGQGPAPSLTSVSPTKGEPALFLVPGGPETGVRPLSVHETLTLAGYSPHAKQKPEDPDRSLAAAKRGLGASSATAVVSSLLRWVGEDIDARGSKAGMCLHPEELELERRVITWMAAWRLDPDAPSSIIGPWWKPTSAPKEPRPKPYRKIGGRKGLQTPRKGRPTREVRNLDALIRHPEDIDVEDEIRQARGRSERAATLDFAGARMQLLLQGIAPGTSTAYASAWRQWEAFGFLRKQDPVLAARSWEESREHEEMLLDFCAHLKINMNRAAGTIKSKLFAIRHHHVVNGWGDPTRDKPRVALLLRALKRKQKMNRKFPVTSRMMRWIKSNLDLTLDNDRVFYADVCTAYFFLLRAGEHLCHDGRPYDYSTVLRGCDFTFRRDGEVVERAADAEEVSIRIRSSKADIYNSGESRNHWRTGEELCVVEALALLQGRFPQRFGKGEDAESPLFRAADGAPLYRSYVQDWLERAALAEGYPPTRFGSHSLRIGGATALLHLGVSVEIIKRWGRWASDCFQGYLWESSLDSKGLAKGMALDQTTLMATRTR